MQQQPFALGRFRAVDRVFIGLVVENRVRELGPAGGVGNFRDVSDIDDLLADWEAAFRALVAEADRDTPSVALDDLEILAPISRPPRVFNAAANYRAHVAGMRQNFTNNLPKIDPNKPLPKLEPYLFVKVSPVSGPFDDIVLPPGTERIDWEAELAVVIGRGGKNIPRERVGDHIAGYMTGNDISCRDRTWREDRPAVRSDWLTGKSYDSFSPTGPFFVPKAFVPDHANLRIRLWVNGQLKQDGNSKDMIFDIEDQIGFASNMLTLLPGDIFQTGTPAGTGQERGEFLKVGDVVETEIELCGRQRNRVVAGSSAYLPGSRQQSL